MYLSLSQRQYPEPTGGASDSVLKQSERYLRGSTDVQRALARLKDEDTENAEEYVSLMDYIICAIFPEIKPSCFAFYQDEGPPLRQLLSRKQVKDFDNLILAVLKLVTHLESLDSPLTWNDVRIRIIQHFALHKIIAPTKADWMGVSEVVKQQIVKSLPQKNYRRNADSRLRELERRIASGDVGALKEYVIHCARIGVVPSKFLLHNWEPDQEFPEESDLDISYWQEDDINKAMLGEEANWTIEIEGDRIETDYTREADVIEEIRNTLNVCMKCFFPSNIENKCCHCDYQGMGALEDVGGFSYCNNCKRVLCTTDPCALCGRLGYEEFPNSIDGRVIEWHTSHHGVVCGMCMTSLRQSENITAYHASILEPYDKSPPLKKMFVTFRCASCGLSPEVFAEDQRRNPDEEIERARRKAEQGEDVERYLRMVRRAAPDRYYEEAQRLFNDNERYVDFLISEGVITAAVREEALSYLRQQRFAFIFEPTAEDMLREGHEAVCHADDYPGHCCVSQANLTRIWVPADEQYEIQCRECESLLGTVDEGNDNIWIGGTHYLPTCAQPPDDPDMDYY